MEFKPIKYYNDFGLHNIISTRFSTLLNLGRCPIYFQFIRVYFIFKKNIKENTKENLWSSV